MSNAPRNLYAVEWRDRVNKPQVSLVSANTHSFALQAVEEEAPGQILLEATVRRVSTGDGDSYHYATIVWTGGSRPEGC